MNASFDKTRLLLAHYRALFAHADYVYLVSDSASCGPGDYLRDLALTSLTMKNTPLVMVKPGFETLCHTCQCDSYERASELNKSTRENHAPFVNSMTRRELFNLYCMLGRPNVKSVGCHGFHVMLSADSEWDKSGHLSLKQDELWTNISEERALLLAVSRKRRDYSQIVISQNSGILIKLREICQTGIKGAFNSDGLITLTVNDEGYLYDPFEAEETEKGLLARMARKKLNALVRQQPVYIDDSALRHPQASEMLNNIKQGLVQAEKQLIVLANKNEPLALSEMLLTRAQETQPTVRFLWLRDSIGKTEALTDALLTDTASLPSPTRISFITDRVTRAEKIQQKLAGLGVLLEIYSVNNHGFLSYRGRKQTSLQAGNSLSTAKNKQLIEYAVKNGDIDTVLSLASDKDAFKNGVITCLCEKKADILEALLRQADRIQATIINWWILEYKQFLSPAFLMENPKFYDLLVRALLKCHFTTEQVEKWLNKLQDLEDSPTAAKVELSFLISLLEKSRMQATLPRIRRADIPKELPRSERSEVDLLRGRLQELKQKQESLIKEIERLNLERSEVECDLSRLEAELSSMVSLSQNTNFS